MQSEIWGSEQPVLSDDLILDQSSLENAIKQRVTDTFAPGVLSNSQLLSEVSPFLMAVGSNSIVGNPTLTVNSGVAIAPSGERIIIPSLSTFEAPTITGTTVSSGQVGLLNTLTPNGPLTTSSDGLGGWETTPRVSGSVNIPLIQNATNSIWIGYLETIDPTIFTLSVGVNRRLFTSGSDGYTIVVTTGATPSGDFILLGRVVVTNTFASANISTAARSVGKTLSGRVGIAVATANRPSAYAEGTATVLDDHINAIGSGIISPTNPHGLTGADIGVATAANLGVLLSNGLIVPDASVTGSALRPVATSSGVPSENVMAFKALVSTEQAAVNGTLITSAMIPTDVSFSFVVGGTPIAVGTYTYYVDFTARTVIQAPVNTTLNSLNDLALASIYWNGTSLDLNTLKDLRSFGVVSTSNLRYETSLGLATGLPTATRATKYFAGRLIGSQSGVSFNVTGDTLIATVDGGSPLTVTFIGTNPISTSLVISQIKAAMPALEVTLTPNNKIKLLAATSISMGAGTANSVLGFTSGDSSSGDLIECMITGDEAIIAGKNTYVSYDYSGVSFLTSNIDATSGLNVNGLTLRISLNGDGPQLLTFSGTNPISRTSIESQINSTFVGVVAANSGNFISLGVTDPKTFFSLYSGTSNSVIGFTPADSTLVTSTTSVVGNKSVVSLITYVDPTNPLSNVVSIADYIS